VKLAARLTVLFLAISILPLAMASCLACEDVNTAVEQDAVDHLSHVAVLKEGELDRWIANNEQRLQLLATRPLVSELALVVAAAQPESPGSQDPDSAMLGDHLALGLEQGGSIALHPLRGEDGPGVLSTERGLERGCRDRDPDLSEGQAGTCVQSVGSPPWGQWRYP
jgi:hypothetical protein